VTKKDMTMNSSTSLAPAVVVAIDESATSRAALVWAAKYARAVGARLQAVHVTQYDFGDPVTWAPGLLGAPHTLSGDALNLGRHRIEDLYAATSPEPSWSLHFIGGPVGHEIVAFARNAELLVIGTREHRGLERLLVGSVSHYCLGHAQCPVVAVPDPLTTTSCEPDAVPLAVTALS
jgi:nucleotide-binding universal stress UspA family protein